MKGNINPFSGDKQYQTDRTLQFKLSRIEETYNHDLWVHNKYNLIFLCIFSIMLMIYSYFSNSCHISSSECTHQILFLLNIISFFITAYFIAKTKQLIDNITYPLLFLINGFYPYMKILEEFEGKIPWILITAHLTILAFFLIYSWKKVLLYEFLAYFLIYIYLSINDHFLLENLLMNVYFGILTILISVFLLCLHEKSSKERWVLFDSFKKSERLFEFLIDEINFPLFLVDSRNMILLFNSQARLLLQMAGINKFIPNNFNQKNFARSKIMGNNKNFFELFLQENSQNMIIAKVLLNSIFSEGKTVVSGLLKLTLSKTKDLERLDNNNISIDNLINEESSQLFAEEFLYEMCCQAFIWKGLKCGLIGLKAEKQMQISNHFHDMFIQKSLQTIMDLIYSHSMEEQFYYDSLLQNTTLMENNKLLYNRLYVCHSLLFFTSLLRNFMLNNFEKITLEPEDQYFQNFLPNEMLTTINQIMKRKIDKYDLNFEIVAENEKNPIILEKNYSNNISALFNDLAEKNLNPDKKSMSENENAQGLYGPCYMIQHLILILIRSVLKLKLSKKITLSYKIEKNDNIPNLSQNLSGNNPMENDSFNKQSKLYINLEMGPGSSNNLPLIKLDEDMRMIKIEVVFEEYSEKNEKHGISNNMLVGDLLLETFKEKKKVQEFLLELMKIDATFTEADRDSSFLYLRNKKARNIGIFFLPYMIKALDAKYEVAYEVEFNKTITRFILKCPVRRSKREEQLIFTRKTPVFEEKKLSNEDNVISHKGVQQQIIKKKPVLSQKNQIISFNYYHEREKEDSLKHEEFKGNDNVDKNDSNNMIGFLKRSTSKEYQIKEEINKKNAMDLQKNQPISMSFKPVPHFYEQAQPQPSNNSNPYNIKKKSTTNNSNQIAKKDEIYVEEELKKYLFHLQNGFTATVENILHEILNEESAKDAKIIFPPKSLLFEENQQPNIDSNSRYNQSKAPKKALSIKNSISLIKNNSLKPPKSPLISDEKDEASSFFFTESNKTESMLTGKSNEEILLNEVSSELIHHPSQSVFAKENSRTQSNKLHPRTILKNDKRFFRSPILSRTDEEKHVLVRGESLIKYLKINTVPQENNYLKPNNFEKDLKLLLSDKMIKLSGGGSRNSDKSKKGKKNINIRMLTYTRKWFIYVGKDGVKKIETEINCAVYDKTEPTSFEYFPNKNSHEIKIFRRKPTKKPKSIISLTDENKEIIVKNNQQKQQVKKKNQNVLNNIKQIAFQDHYSKLPERFEEIKQEDDFKPHNLKKTGNKKYQQIMANINYKEKVTILAYDSEKNLNDPNKCKGVKSLALRVGHDYKFDLCNSGLEVIKSYKAFIQKSCIYHLIIIELDMPQMDGWKCVRKIRNFEAKYNSKHRLFICGLLNDDQRDYEAYVRWGFDEFLKKPFNSGLFEQIVKRKVEIMKEEEAKLRGKSKEPENLPVIITSSEHEAFKISVSEVLKEAKIASHQKEPILMLTIDDNLFILMGMGNLRLKLKYKMEIAKSGKLGLEVYRNFLAKSLLFHIIFIDIDMPDMDGLEVTRLIRAIESEFSLKRSFICGLVTEENNKFDVYHEQGMDEFLKKPVNVQVLNELIDRRLLNIEAEQILLKQSKIEDNNFVILEKKPLQEDNVINNKENIKKLLDFEIKEPLKLREKTTFLTIDDNDFILLGISHLKLECEFKMDLSKSGLLGISRFKDMLKNNELYHAIFLDIDMPEMNGLDAAKQIRQIEKQYNLPHTFICGLITDENKDFDTYIEAGMNDFLKKPVNPKSMNLIIQKIFPPKKDELVINIKGIVPSTNEEKKLIINNQILKFKPEITLLAVDDNDFILLGISHLKLEFPYKMEISKSGKQALEKYNALKSTGFLYHAIFLDIDMPEMNGLECTKHIREIENKQSQTTYIVGLINDDYKDVEKYLEVGMNEFLNKPVNPKSMNALLKKRIEDIQKMNTEIKEESKNDGNQIVNKEINSTNSKSENIIKCCDDCTLLAVDDNDFILMGISHLKVDVKYKMDICKNGKLALEKYYKQLDTHHIYHIIFMDIDMPEMNGLECSKKIREFEKTQKIPKTTIVGLINEDYKDIESYLEAGMDEFINKPVNPKAFSAILKKKLEVESISSLCQKDEEIQKHNDVNKIEDKPLCILKYSDEITLLAVDDNDFILIGMSHLRLDVKYKMEIAKSGKKGFEKYEENIKKGCYYHAIFIDIEMPEMNGLQLTKLIREYEKKMNFTQQSYIVGLITDENKDIEHYMEVGMNEFLNKPVHPKTMNEILSRRMIKIKEIDYKNLENEKNIVNFKKEHILKYNNEIMTMLAVDDNDFILIGISHLKIKNGSIIFKMETSRSGKDAFEKYIKMFEKDLIYHCIFIDIEMPGMNGIELSRKIRDYEKNHDIKPESLICGLLTEDTQEIEKYKEAGMNDFLHKPVNPGAMTKFLEEKKLI